MVFVFEKIKVDDVEYFTIRDNRGVVVCSSTDPQKLVDFYKSLGV